MIKVKHKFLDKLEIHTSWGEFLNNDIYNCLEVIAFKIGNKYTPNDNQVLRFLMQDVEKIKVIILGQDPYPQNGCATGRAFEVGGLDSWDTNFKQSSLRNIIKLLYKTYKGKLVEINDLRNEIRNKEFLILPPDKLFNHWENQGVLLLNSSFTCEIGIPNSHREIWTEFKTKLYSFINSQNPEIIWFLWGNEAKNILQEIKIKQFICCSHPMIINYSMPNNFINSNCFERTRSIINWLC